MSLIGTIKYLTIGNSTYEIYNTDTKLTQTTATASGYTYWRPLVIGYSSASTEGTAPTTQTNTTYTFSTLMVQPSSGTIRFGKASLYNGDYTVSLSADTLTTNRTILIPDSDGTLALTTDIVDTKVTQTETTTNSTYELLFSETADNTTRTEGARKSSNLKFNPSTGNLQVTQLNGVTIGSTPKFTDTIYTASNATPAALGTASAGSSAEYSRADHVHAKPTYSASDVGLGNVDNVQQYSASNPPPYPVTSVNGSTGAVTVSVPSKVSDLTNDSGFITGMYIASYGSSTYAEVLAAYQANKVVYCRASSNTNPGTGDKKRLAFLAYVSDPTTPTEFEFQYYRSVATHSDSQQGDQVFVYKLNSSTGWSVTTREAYTKITTGTGLSKSYSNGTLTLSYSGISLPSVTSSDNGKVLTVVNGAWAAASLPVYNGGVS